MGNAINALFYLRAMSFKNAVISRVLRLKQPKYLIGAARKSARKLVRLVGDLELVEQFRRFCFMPGNAVDPRDERQVLAHGPVQPNAAPGLLVFFVASSWRRR